MNLQVLTKSMRRPTPGDIFVYRPVARAFGFGRVIRGETAADDDTLLVYIYRAVSETKEPVPQLMHRQLLLPPLITYTLPWEQGYFERISTRPLKADDILSPHCFRDRLRKCYCDETGALLPRRVEPCGEWGVDLPGLIDIRISEALGIPVDPDTLPSRGDFTEPQCSADQGVCVFIKLATRGLSNSELTQLFELEDRLEAIVRNARMGELEGHEIGEGYFQVVFRGSAPKELVDVILPVLRDSRVRSGSFVVYATERGQERTDVVPG